MPITTSIKFKIKILGMAQFGGMEYIPRTGSGILTIPRHILNNVFYGMLTHSKDGTLLSNAIPVIISLDEHGTIVRVRSNTITNKILYEALD